MYHPTVVKERLDAYVDRVRVNAPTFDPLEKPIDECVQMAALLAKAFDTDGKLTRPLTERERDHIASEMALCRSSFVYWVERYAKIRSEGGTLIVVPLRRTQQIVLRELGKLEASAKERNDGVLALCLKARQLGISTLAELLIIHKAIFYANRYCLIASDTPESSGYLFGMIERVYENLPIWMKPTKTEHVKNSEMVFGEIDTKIHVGWGNATRGQKGQARSRLAQGMTLNALHCSELSTWTTPQQLDSSVNPTLPRHQNTFGLYEGTALGRGNWLHETWQAACRGTYRFKPIFIPWAVEVEKYAAPAPFGWEPTTLTQHHGDKVQRVMAEWCGISLVPTKDQLYWYEQTREDYASRKQLHAFQAEFAADDKECFANSGASYFSPKALYEAEQSILKLQGLAEVNLDPTIDWAVR